MRAAASVLYCNDLEMSFFLSSLFSQRNIIANNMAIMALLFNTLAADPLPERSAFSVVLAVPNHKSESRPEDQLGEHERLHNPHPYVGSHRSPLLPDGGGRRQAPVRHVLCAQTRSAASSTQLAETSLSGEICAFELFRLCPQ